MKYFKTFEEFSEAGSVPGMGNPIAPGPDSIGSGDTWNTLGATGTKKKRKNLIERIELDDLKDTSENNPGYVFLSAESDHSSNLPYFEICRTYGKESFHYRINNRPGMLDISRRQYGDSFPITLTKRVNPDILERYINFYKELGININEHPNQVGKSEPHILFDFPIEPRMQKNWGDNIVKKLTVFSFRLLTDNVNLYFQSIKNSVYDWSNLNTDERIQKLMQKYNIKDAGSFDDKTITPLQKKLLHSHRGESVGHRAGILAEDAI